MVIYYNSLSLADRDKIEKEKAHRSNVRYYPRLFKQISNNLNKDWYVRAIEGICGGKIYAINKRFPNVYIILNVEYNSLEDKAPLVISEFEFYIDENHFQTIAASWYMIINRPEELNILVETAVKCYCNSPSNGLNSISINKLENHLLYNTGKEYIYMKLSEIEKWDGRETMRYYLQEVKSDENNNFLMATSYVEEISNTTKWIISNINSCLKNPFVCYEIEKEKDNDEYLFYRPFIFSTLFVMIFVLIVICLENCLF